MLDETQVSFLKKVSCVKFGYWTLLTQEQSINDGETNRTLEPLVFDLLLYFIIHSDRIISRQELIGNVWKQNYVDDNAINRAISELRKALKSEKQIGRIIKTHYRTGYSFMLPVELEYSADKLVSSEQEATTIKVNPSDYVTSRASSEASDNQPISQSQAVIAPLANKQPSTTQTYITQKKYQSWYSMVLLFLLVGSIAYLSYYSLKAEAPSVLANKQPLQPSPLSLSEEMLSWDEGSVGVVKLSKDKQLLAYSFDNLQEAEYSLHIKDLNTLKLYKIKSGSDYISPLAWSEEHTLVYQILNLVNAKCELWQVDLSKLELSNDHKKLFDCGATEIISAGIATIDNKLIYTKYNYRGRKNLSAIVNRSLNTGEEFQISSPNSELRGDYFVALADDQQKVAFLRRQHLKTEVFVANKDGSEQIKVTSVDYGIRLLAWANSDTELLWFNPLNSNLVTFNLNTKQLSTQHITSEHSLSIRFKTEIINDRHFILATKNYAYDVDQLKPNSKTPVLTSFLNSPQDEISVTPFNLSNANIFVVWHKKFSLWIYKDGVRKRLFADNIKRISGVSLSPDDSMLLIATNKALFIYDTQDYTLLKEILLSGQIKQASWASQDKILLTYTEEGSKTFAWFYHLEQEKLLKLTNRYTLSAKLISKDTLLFLDESFQLISKNINSGEYNPLVTLSDKAGIKWTANEHNIYYIKNKYDRFIRKIALNDITQEETFPVSSKKIIYDLSINNNTKDPTLYISYSQKTANHIVDLKVKN